MIDTPDKAKELGVRVDAKTGEVVVWETSPLFPTRSADDAARLFLGTDESQVVIMDLIDGPVVRAFRHYTVRLVPYRSGLGKPQSSITLAVDSHTCRIYKYVEARTDSIQMAGDASFFTSELDLLDPPHPEHIHVLFTPFSRDTYHEPTLERFEMSFGPGELSQVFSEQFDTWRATPGGGKSYDFQISKAVKSAVYR